MTDVKGAVKFTVESDCVTSATFVPGEALNQAVSKAIGQMFDSYCNGGPAYLADWEIKKFSATECQKGYNKLLVDIEFRDKSRIECADSGGVYVRSGNKIAREARRFTTKYVYKNDNGDVASITLPTDEPHDRAADFIQETDDLEFLIQCYKNAGITETEFMGTLEYISNNDGWFTGISSIKPSLVFVLMIRQNPELATSPQFKKLLQQQPSVDANGVAVPNLARYFYALKALPDKSD